MRTLVDIPDADLSALDRLSQRRRASRAKVIRQAVSEYLARNADLSADDAFGIWGGVAEDGLAYQHRIRAEW